MNKKLTIWCAYHNQNLINEYNLCDTDIIKIFWTNDKWYVNGEHINHLNTCLSEVCAYYYVWSNQIKSDYVGFCHYRRYFSDVNYDYINDSSIQGFDYLTFNYDQFVSMANHFHICSNICDIYKEYLKEKSNIDFTYAGEVKINIRLMYIFTWEVFNDIANVMFGFLDFLSKKVGIANWKSQGELLKLIEYISIEKSPHYVHMQNRSLAICIEWLIGIYVNLKYNTYALQESPKVIIYKDGIIDENKQFTLNLKTGIRKIFFNEYTEDFIYKYDIIYLNKDEYINTPDAFEFNKGNYKIAKL